MQQEVRQPGKLAVTLGMLLLPALETGKQTPPAFLDFRAAQPLVEAQGLALQHDAPHGVDDTGLDTPFARSGLVGEVLELDDGARPARAVTRGPEVVAQQLRQLRGQVPFDVASMEVQWAGLPHELARDSLRRLVEDVVPLLGQEQAGPPG